MMDNTLNLALYSAEQVAVVTISLDLDVEDLVVPPEVVMTTG